MFEEPKSKVYIKVDENNNVTAVEGGYSIGNIHDFSQWILIDEGTGDKYNHCQNHYLGKPIMDWEYGIYNYAYIDGQIVEKDLTEEIATIVEKREVDELRRRRETECFSIINRGALWYDRITDEQLEELNSWYQAWLDVTETRVVPEKPSWLE